MPKSKHHKKHFQKRAPQTTQPTVAPPLVVASSQPTAVGVSPSTSAPVRAPARVTMVPAGMYVRAELKSILIITAVLMAILIALRFVV